MVYIHVGGTYQKPSKDGIVHHIHISDDELKEIAYAAGYQLSNECKT
jgi:hypothetical protein